MGDSRYHMAAVQGRHRTLGRLIIAATLVASGCRAGSALKQATTAAPRIAATVRVPTATATPVLEGAALSTPTVSAPQAPVSASPVDRAGALALGGATPVRSLPSMIEGTTVRTLPDRQPVEIQREVRGQRWVVGDQGWAMAIQDWSNIWYQIDGGYVYAGFVFIPRPGELNAVLDRSGAHWVDVDLNAQTATAMISDRSVHVAAATTGKPGFETPGGEHSVQYRKFNETMTSAQAAIQDPNEQYDVKNVLYTQYFDGAGDALHLNYWQPDGVFGRQRSSHGCVGLELHDAQFFWLFASSGSRVSIHPIASSTARPSSSPAASSTAAATSATGESPSATSLATTVPAPTQDPRLTERFTRTGAAEATIPPPPPPPVFPARPPAR